MYFHPYFYPTFNNEVPYMQYYPPIQPYIGQNTMLLPSGEVEYPGTLDQNRNSQINLKV